LVALGLTDWEELPEASKITATASEPQSSNALMIMFSFKPLPPTLSLSRSTAVRLKQRAYKLSTSTAKAMNVPWIQNGFPPDSAVQSIKRTIFRAEYSTLIGAFSGRLPTCLLQKHVRQLQHTPRLFCKAHLILKRHSRKTTAQRSVVQTLITLVVCREFKGVITWRLCATPHTAIDFHRNVLSQRNGPE
jgi:hypothetical protein